MRIFLCFLALLPLVSQAQDSTQTTIHQQSISTSDTAVRPPVVARKLLSKEVIRIEFFGPGLIRETRIGKSTTLNFHLRLIGAAQPGQEYRVVNQRPTVQKVLRFRINPEISAAIRKFYNLEKRKAAGKSIRYNSGNYVALRANYILPAVYKSPYLEDSRGAGVAALWGFQRTYPKRFYLNLELGLRAAEYTEPRVLLTGHFLIGYTLR